MMMIDKKVFRHLKNSNLDRELLYTISIHVKSTMHKNGYGFIYKEDYEKDEWREIIREIKKCYR